MKRNLRFKFSQLMAVLILVGSLSAFGQLENSWETQDKPVKVMKKAAGADRLVDPKRAEAGKNSKDEKLEVQESVYVPWRTVNLRQLQKATLEEVLDERMDEDDDSVEESNEGDLQQGSASKLIPCFDLLFNSLKTLN